MTPLVTDTLTTDGAALLPLAIQSLFCSCSWRGQLRRARDAADALREKNAPAIARVG